jgi:capping protein (actin filament) muscle Z-line, alpha
MKRLMKRQKHFGRPPPRHSTPLLIAISAALDNASQEYINEHYKDGVASAFSSSPGKFVIQLVANKYNPQNFWSGRWRSKYEIDLNEKSVKAAVNVTVHYYEQGNVSRHTSMP